MYEYRFVTTAAQQGRAYSNIDQAAVEAQFNALSQAGWELVSVQPTYAVFRRSTVTIPA